MSNEGKHRDGRSGAGRRVYPLDGAPPRVGRVAKNVPPAQRVDAQGVPVADGSAGDRAPSAGVARRTYRTPSGPRAADSRRTGSAGNSYAARSAGESREQYSSRSGGETRNSYAARSGGESQERYPSRNGGESRNSYAARSAGESWGGRSFRTGGAHGAEFADSERHMADSADPKKRVADAADPKKRGGRRLPAAAAQPLPEDGHLLCGRNPIREALRAGKPVEKLLVAAGDLSGAAQEIVQLAREAGAVVQRVDRTRLDQIYPAHQGMIATVAAVAYSTVDEMLERAAARGEAPFLVLLDGITDPHNLGAIVRTAECVGAHGVVLPERRSAGLTPAAAKAAAGALSYMPIARVTNLNRAIDDLKARGVWIVGAAMDGESAFSADLSGPVALVIGSEGDGISRLTLEKCDRRVALPMKGHLDSLNASVAAGVLMYAIARART